MENGKWKMIDRDSKNQRIPNSINFDYCDEFHKGIEKEVSKLN